MLSPCYAQPSANRSQTPRTECFISAERIDQEIPLTIKSRTEEYTFEEHTLESFDEIDRLFFLYKDAARPLEFYLKQIQELFATKSFKSFHLLIETGPVSPQSGRTLATLLNENPHGTLRTLRLCNFINADALNGLINGLKEEDAHLPDSICFEYHPAADPAPPLPEEVFHALSRLLTEVRVNPQNERIYLNLPTTPLHGAYIHFLQRVAEYYRPINFMQLSGDPTARPLPTTMKTSNLIIHSGHFCRNEFDTAMAFLETHGNAFEKISIHLHPKQPSENLQFKFSLHEHPLPGSIPDNLKRTKTRRFLSKAEIEGSCLERLQRHHPDCEFSLQFPKNPRTDFPELEPTNLHFKAPRPVQRD